MPPRLPGEGETIMVARKADVKPQGAGANGRFVMGAGGTSLSRVRTLAFYQVRYCYTCIVTVLWDVFTLITGRRFRAGGFGEIRSRTQFSRLAFVLKYLDNV